MDIVLGPGRGPRSKRNRGVAASAWPEPERFGGLFFGRGFLGGRFLRFSPRRPMRDGGRGLPSAATIRFGGRGHAPSAGVNRDILT